ncbi:coil containing protein [Vibrio phage 1.022.O._10N.286.45.A10]|nr:coil containing protein [Vibrio phage 1.022.O._10N.286.45.A10]
MGRKNRGGAPSKRQGSNCSRKMMSAKNAAKRLALRIDSLDRLARKMKQRVESKAKLKERSYG